MGITGCMKFYVVMIHSINLCAEKGYVQTGQKPFGNRFTRYSIRDHNACSLSKIIVSLIHSHSSNSCYY